MNKSKAGTWVLAQRCPNQGGKPTTQQATAHHVSMRVLYFAITCKGSQCIPGPDIELHGPWAAT